MSENAIDRDVIERLIDMWADNYGKTFRAANRKDRLGELIQDLVYNGAEAWQIKSARKSIMRKMVGRRTPFGASNLKDWNEAAEEDFDAALRAAFTKVKVRTENIEIQSAQLSTEEEQAESLKKQTEEYKEYQKDLANAAALDSKSENVEYDKDPVIRPELDRSRFREIKATPIMSVEDFLATVERENNE